MGTLVFVQGACVRDQAWWWGRMAEPLTARGLATVAVELPTCNGTGTTLAHDIAATAELIAAVEPPVTLVGHSYGGMVVTGAGVHPSVARVVYLTAAVPDEGESQSDVYGGGAPPPWIDPGEDGTVGVHADVVREVFLWDVDSETADEAVARLTRQPAGVFTEPVPVCAWREKPSAFIVCARDRAIPEDVQRRFATRTQRVAELATGHFPFLTAPERLADALLTA
jgi:pimeloyl-ACP methyl ester carboxylesterase